MNVLENTDLLTQETLMHTVNELSLYPKTDKQWEDKFAQDGAKVGSSIRLRKPTNFDIRDGKNFTPQALQDPYITFSVDQQFGVDIQYDSEEATMSLDRLSERYLQPAARRIANEIDFRIARVMAREATLFVGTPAVTPTTSATYQSAISRLLNLGVPKKPRHIIQTPDAQQAVVTDLRGLFNPDGTIAKQNLTGAMYRAFGADWDIDQNLYVHTAGSVAGSGLVNGANQSGSTVLTNSWTASSVGILKHGDKITFPDVYAVNPITGQRLGFLRPFTVTADVDSDGSNEATIPISPAIVLTGPYKNVSQAPTTATDVQLWGHASTYANTVSALQLAFHKSTCAVAVVGLAKPNGGAKCSYKSDPDAGISIRYVEQYDIDTDMNKGRFDVLIGIKMQLPDFCVVIPSAS